MTRLFTGRAIEAAQQALVKTEAGPGAVARPFSSPLPKLWEPPRRLLARRKLNREVAKWLSTAKNYQVNGLPAGSAAYQQLYRQCCDAIKHHSDQWTIPMRALAIEFPALYGLEKTAYPERAPKTRSPWITGAVVLAVAILFLAFVLGMASGVYQLAQRAVTR